MAKEELGFVPEVRDPPRTYPPPPPVSRCSSLRHANKNRAVLRTRGRRVHWCEESALKARGAQAPWATPELLGMADEYPVRRNASAFALRRVGEDPGRRAYDEFAERRAEASPEAGPTNRGSGRAGAVSECRVSTAARLTARAPDRRLGTSGSSRSPRRRPTRSPSRGGGSLGRPTSTGIASGRSLMPTPRSSAGRRGSRRLRSQCPTTSPSIGPPPRTTACCSPCPSLCCTALRARRAGRVKEKERLMTMVAKLNGSNSTRITLRAQILGQRRGGVCARRGHRSEPRASAPKNAPAECAVRRRSRGPDRLPGRVVHPKAPPQPLSAADAIPIRNLVIRPVRQRVLVADVAAWRVRCVNTYALDACIRCAAAVQRTSCIHSSQKT